ncbi:MAG: ATP-dependent Clp protease adapter ClpS [Pseudomonadales bacterium]|nr:ATP-dependent Clp protease adapter ClpS [Pseudomonadales bacterium]
MIFTQSFTNDLSYSQLSTAVKRITCSDDEPSRDHDLTVLAERPQLKQPEKYQVVLMNDDYTPMEFVVEVLEMFFYMNREKATQIMLAVHTQGKGVCGIYPKDIAETKSAQVNEFSRTHQHPLLCEVEAIE